ncbi:MAG: hypoxanthine phosphoribosyltransferase [Actinomycetota bacterium]
MTAPAATAPGDEWLELLISRDSLRDRVTALGEEIASDYGAEAEPPVLVSVLKGSSLFLADVVRAAQIDLAVDFMSISAYGDPEKHSGVVRIVKDLETDIVGRDVLIIEDIVDTGLTLTYLRRTLGARGPRSLRTATLLDKSVRRIVPVEIEYVGFEIPDVFVIGYGLDFQALFRNLPDIYAVHDLEALARDPAGLSERLWPVLGG